MLIDDPKTFFIYRQYERIPNLSQRLQRSQRFQRRSRLRSRLNRRRATMIRNSLIRNNMVRNNVITIRSFRSTLQRNSRIRINGNRAIELQPRSHRGNRRRPQRKARRSELAICIREIPPGCSRPIARSRARSQCRTRKSSTRRRLRSDLRQKLRHRTSLHQRIAHRVARKVVHNSLLPESHLGLRRMHIHIHFRRGHLDKKQHHRINRWRQNIAIRLSQPMLNQPIANQPSINKDVDRVAVELLNLWLRNKSMKSQLARFALLHLIFRTAPPRRRLRQSDSLQRFTAASGIN